VSPQPGWTYRRGEGLEFDRLAFFSDAVFAIALTLLVVTIGIPHVDADDLATALGDIWPQIVSFFIGFAVISTYWLAHHRFVSNLQAIDRRFMTINLGYLAAIAFLPFPTALIGEYASQPISVVVFALTVAAASALESLLFVHAHRARLLRQDLSNEAFRYGLAQALAPAVVFAVSIPFAFLDTTVAMLMWLSLVLIGRLLERLRPPDADGQALL
jgi:uncharacterized membrane protein